MPGYDPALAAQARASMGLAPLDAQPTIEQARANAGLFPQAAEQPSFLEQAMGVVPAPATDAFSMVPSVPQQSTVPVVQSPDFVPTQAPPSAQDGTRRVPEARAGQVGRGPGGGPANPLPGMLNDATARRTVADSARTNAGVNADMALEGQALATEQLGQSQRRTAEATASNRRDAAATEAEFAGKLDAEYDSHRRAADAVSANKRKVDEYIGSYQVKDRRDVMSKAMGALAVFAANMQDQQNLIAGVNMGSPIVTNRGQQMADLIGRQIDRDLEQQREMLSNKRTQSAALGTELGQAYERWGATKESLLTAKQLKLNQFAQGLEAIKAQGASEESVLLADQAIEALRMQQAQIDEQRAQGDYDKAFADEQRLKQAQYAQAVAARGHVPTAKEALDLEGKAIDNALKRKELNQGPGTKLTAEQQKQASFLDGYEAQARTLAQAVASGEGAPGRIERNLPDMVRSTNALSEEAAENAMVEANLRIESGASISEGDVLAKRKSTGLDSGDPKVRLAARRSLVEQYNAKRRGLGMPEVATVVRSGAAR